jgi:hypothetical protein
MNDVSRMQLYEEREHLVALRERYAQLYDVIDRRLSDVESLLEQLEDGDE